MAEYVHFRAGILVRDEGSSMLKPDPRKGLIRLDRDDQSGLTRFRWLERGPDNQPSTSTDGTNLDIAILPGDATFKKVSRPDGSRVFCLQFRMTPDVSLFWAQEPDPATDAANIDRVNTIMNSINNGMNIDEDDKKETPHAPTATPAADAPTALLSHDTGGNKGAIAASQLAAALGNIMSGSAPPSDADASEQQRSTGPALGDVLKADRIIPLLENPKLVDKLAPFLPPEFQSVDKIIDVLHSPQFKHQLDLLTRALATGQLGTTHFGLGSEPAFGVSEFLKAIQRGAADKDDPSAQDGGNEGDTGGGS